MKNLFINIRRFKWLLTFIIIIGYIISLISYIALEGYNIFIYAGIVGCTLLMLVSILALYIPTTYIKRIELEDWKLYDKGGYYVDIPISEHKLTNSPLIKIVQHLNGEQNSVEGDELIDKKGNIKIILNSPMGNLIVTVYG
ncbi:hypothetical protein [Galbibacter sp. BG1]